MMKRELEVLDISVISYIFLNHGTVSLLGDALVRFQDHIQCSN